MYLHGANLSLPHLRNRLSTCVPQTYRSIRRDVPSSSGAWWRQLPDHGRRAGEGSGGGNSLFGCGEGRSCRRKRHHPRVWCTHAEGLRACTSNLNSPSLFIAYLNFWSFSLNLSWLSGLFFFVAVVICSLYILLDPLKTHTKTGPLFYWVLLKCSPMPQWACGITRQNKEGGHVTTATGMWPLLAPTGVIKWEQGHIAPPSLEKQKLWGLVQKTTPVAVWPCLAAVFFREIRIVFSLQYHNKLT